MKTMLLWCISFFIPFLLAAQEGDRNLIPNYSFEDVNICTKYSEPCCPEAWRSATLKAFYYSNDIKSRDQRIKAFEGHRYVSLCFFNSKRDFDRRFIQTRLLCPLEEGMTYELSIQVRSLSKVIDNFGACFFDTLSNQRSNNYLEGKHPDIILKVDENIKLGEWSTVRAQYKAKGGEQVIMIGNFDSDEQTDVQWIDQEAKKNYSIHPNSVYYHLDNIQLLAPENAAFCQLEHNRLRIYNDNIRHSRPAQQALEVNVPDTVEISHDSETPVPDKKEYILIEEDSIEISEDFELPNILFDHNSDRLLPVAYASLKKLANFMIRHPDYVLLITGHTDSDGQRYFNQQLSEKRAQAVKDYLIQEGIRHQFLVAEGKGEDLPVATNETEVGKAKNRRVIFKLITDF